MARYELKSPGGRSIKVDVDGDMDETIANEIMSADSEAAYKKLSSFSGKGKNKKEERAELKKNISQALGISDDQFDETRGADFKTRSLVDFLPTQSEKVSQLQKKYGENNVKPLRVGGDDRIVFRDDTDGKFRLFDEQGFSMKDLTADIAGEVVPTVASIGAAIPAAAATIGSGGIAAPLAIGAASGTAHAVTGFVQDMAARQLSGQDQQYGEAVKRRGVEGLITGGADALTAGVARPIARMWGDRAVGAGAEKISSLMKKYDVDYGKLPSGVTGTSSEASAALKRAGNLPKGAEAKQLSNVRDRIPGSLQELRESFGGTADDTIRYVKEVQARADDAVNAAQKAKIDADAAKANLSRSKGQATAEFPDAQSAARGAQADEALNAARAMRNQIDEQLEKVVRGRRARADSGEDLRLLRLQGQEIAEKRVKGLYTEAYRRADVMNAETSPTEVGAMMQEALGNAGYALNEVGEIGGKTLEGMKDTFGDKLGRIYNRFLQRANSRGLENMQFSELDEYVRAMGSAVNWKKFSGKNASPDERAFKKFYDDMVKLRNKKLDDAGVPAKEKYMEATEAYKKEVRPYVDDNLLAASGREITRGTGEYDLPPEQIVDRALASNQAATRFIDRASNPDLARKILQQQFLAKKLPQQAGQARKEIPLSADDTKMMQTLWGKGKEGWTNPRNEIRSLNKLIAKYGDAAETISPLDRAKFIASKTKKEQRALEKAMEQQLKTAKAEKDLLSDKLVGLVNNRVIEIPADVNSFAREVMTSAKTPSELKQFMDNITDPNAKAGLQRAIFDNLLKESGWDSAMAQRSVAGGKDLPLWEPKAMQQFLRRGPNGQPATADGKKLLVALGEEGYERLELYNELLTRASKVTNDNAGSIGRLVATSAGESGVPKILVVSAAPFTAVGRRLMGVLHTTDMLEPYLRSFSNPKSINPTALKNAMTITLSTNKGRAALQDEAKRDPEFARWVEQYYNQVYIPDQNN